MAYKEVLEPTDEWLLELRNRRILWIIPLVAVLYMLWLVVLMSTAAPPVFPVQTWAIIGSGLFVVMIAFLALLLIRTHARPVVQPGQPFERERAEAAPTTPSQQRIVTWPPEQSGDEGLYVSHHIELKGGRVLKFRQEIRDDWIR